MSKLSFSKAIEQFKKKPQGALPVKAGRSSSSVSAGIIGGLFADMSTIDPDYPIQLLDTLTHLAKFNGDLSYAVDNIVQLGSTFDDDFSNVKFDGDVPQERVREMLMHLKTKSKTWYTHSGGITSLINDLLAQVAVSGALSSEYIVSEGLDGVHKVVLVDPAKIRFVYDNENDNYVPHQLAQDGFLRAGVNSNMVELNEITYKYAALRRFSEKPYAIPPFLSALEHIVVEHDMVDNLKHVVKKLGVLGFLSAMVNAPQQKPAETDSDYLARCQKHLNAVVPEIEKGLNKGYVVGFKESHEFEMQSTTSNVQGAKDLFELNDVKKMAGLKQDPLMFGRNFSTTETLGRVVLAKMTTQVRNYQSIIKGFLEDLFYTELVLSGYDISFVEVTLEAPMIGDTNREETARGIKIDNLNKLYEQGVIDQDQRAQELGYEEAAEAEPRIPIENNDPLGEEVDPVKPKKGTDPTKGDDKKPKKKKVSKNSIKAEVAAYVQELGGLHNEYQYSVEGCNCEVASFAKKADLSTLEQFIQAYYVDTRLNYDKASKKAIRDIALALQNLGEGASVSYITDVIFYHLYKNWSEYFTAKQRGIIKKWVTASYNNFRKDKAIFGATTKKIPKGVFEAQDLRVLNYFRKSDELYLGKFITDDDLKTSINKYIQEEYQLGRLPVGNSSIEIKRFKQKFGDIMQGQDFKLMRILTTTISKLRNVSAIHYMEQAEVEKYEIRGISDRLQCGYCAALQGKQFVVSNSISYIANTMVSDPEIIKIDAPFITGIYKKPEDMKNLTEQELQSNGVHFPPYHPSCRDQAIAVL